MENKNKKMFGLTKKANKNPKNNNPSNQGGLAPFNIEAAPIHTMQDDLNKLKNPDTPKPTLTAEIKNTPLNQAPPQRQSTSPFLSSRQKTEEFPKKESFSDQLASPLKSEQESFSDRKSAFSPTSEKERLDLLKNANISVTPSMVKDYSAFRYSWRKFFFTTVILFLLSVIGWLGFRYYEDENFNPFEEISILTGGLKTTEKKEGPIEKQTTTTPDNYSTENPNYLRLENLDLDKEKTITIIKGYSENVFAQKHTVPIEFIVTDNQNKALGFKSFSDAIGLGFSPALLTLLGESFSLYVYNDINAPKVGISIESRDDINLAKVLLSEENNLANEINSFFFTTDYRTDKDFFTSEYGGAKIRYQNIISPSMLSVDYTVYKNKLLIGTTKQALRSIIDKLNGVMTETMSKTTEGAETTP